jgi:hypothetical protein
VAERIPRGQLVVEAKLRVYEVVVADFLQGNFHPEHCPEEKATKSSYY